jgi:23S rRNA (cytidine1920-2'-O)/16S rRNA (cytidine1409-2'-O)-methyltransferase
LPKQFKGSQKLAFILDQNPHIQIEDCICADLGCNVGGFTKELLDRKAKTVYAIDTGYGTLEWSLRQDERVEVHERKNALFADWLPKIDIIVSDVAWTKQQKLVDAAFRYIKPGGVIFSLLKPPYERPLEKKGKGKVLYSEEECQRIALETHEQIGFPDSHSVELFESPVRGGSRQKGTLEFWLVFSPKSQ